MGCKHLNNVKWGTYINKNGRFQKYKCRDCGSTWIGEKLFDLTSEVRSKEEP